MQPIDRVLIPLILGLLIAAFAGDEINLPVITPVESPFPADNGPWLLLAAEANELTGVLGVGNAKSLHDAVPVNRRVLDYSETDEPAPWIEALSHAETKGGGQAYFVYRDGNRAAEGVLAGSLKTQLDTIKQALGVE